MRRLLPPALAIALAVSCAPMPAPTPVPVPVPQAPARPPVQPSPGPGPERFQLDREPTIDVGLAWDLDTLSIASAGARAPWWVRGSSSASGSLVALQLKRTPAGAGIEGWADGKLVLGPMASTDTLWIGDVGTAEPTLRWRGKAWRGRGKVFVGPRGGITLALRLPLETYLAGVVPGEIGGLSEGLIQAGRAQAIAARSYTLFYLGRRAAEGFDVYGTVEDQVYGPVESERPIASRCVESTRGEIAVFEDRPIRANYYSTCGGVTADAWEGWPVRDYPYLRSHRDAIGRVELCADSPQFRWLEEWPANEFVANLQKYAPAESVSLPPGGVGELVDVRVATRSRSGRVWRLEVVTTTGTIEIPAYSIRRVLRRPGANNGAILRSTLFKIDVRRDRASRKALAVVASGAGSGHGVGLCQTGALGMARGGSSGEDILEHYYPGAALKRFY